MHRGGAGQPGHQQVGEEEVTQVIHTKLHLISILGLHVGTLVNACIVDQHINLRLLLMGQRHLKPFKTQSQTQVRNKVLVISELLVALYQNQPKS